MAASRAPGGTSKPVPTKRTSTPFSLLEQPGVDVRRELDRLDHDVVAGPQSIVWATMLTPSEVLGRKATSSFETPSRRGRALASTVVDGKLTLAPGQAGALVEGVAGQRLDVALEERRLAAGREVDPLLDPDEVGLRRQ